MACEHLAIERIDVELFGNTASSGEFEIANNKGAHIYILTCWPALS
jgi:hypothetical protein